MAATLPDVQVFSSATFTKTKTFLKWIEKEQPLICQTLTHKHTHILSLANKCLFTKSDPRLCELTVQCCCCCFCTFG